MHQSQPAHPHQADTKPNTTGGHCCSPTLHCPTNLLTTPWRVLQVAQYAVTDAPQGEAVRVVAAWPSISTHLARLEGSDPHVVVSALGIAGAPCFVPVAWALLAQPSPVRRARTSDPTTQSRRHRILWFMCFASTGYRTPAPAHRNSCAPSPVLPVLQEAVKALYHRIKHYLARTFGSATSTPTWHALTPAQQKQVRAAASEDCVIARQMDWERCRVIGIV